MNTIALPRPKLAFQARALFSDPTRLLCVLFFFSGFPALVYQLVWQRALFRIFGVNSESVTIVVTAFMIGLGLGSLAGGIISRRTSVPVLLLLSAIEAATGLFGLFSLSIFDHVGAWTAGQPLPIIAMINLALVALPTLLMGATLPLLIAHLVSVSGRVGHSVGRLYYANTLGAACACLVCALLLFPFLGTRMSIFVAATLNAMVAIGALVAHRHRPRSQVVPEADHPVSRSQLRLPFGKIVWVAGLGGFISLSYEIFFFRLISYGTGSSATAFATTLGIFLAGLASGSQKATTALDNPGETRRFVVGLVLSSVAAACLLPVLGHFAFLQAGLLGIAMLVVFFVARAWGGLMPLLAEFGIAADKNAGLRSAFIYLANIVGSASGCILTGFVLMDVFSLSQVSTLLAFAGLGCAAILVALLPLGPAGRIRAIVVVGAGFVIAGAALIPGSSRTLEVLQRLTEPGFKSLAEIVENRSGIITVDSAGGVYGNGRYDGRFNTKLTHDVNLIVRPFALSLFHPAPRNVLMIGLSSGSWAQVLANNPNVSSLTIIEINPGYVALIARHPEVASLLNNPKVKIIADDGRRWLRLHPQEQFDAIVSNTTWHFRANVTNLLSVEFLDLVKEHLTPNGIFFYNTTDSERVQRTACLSYPFGARFLNHMVVSRSPIAWDFDRWKQVLVSYRIDNQPVLDLSSGRDRSYLNLLMGFAKGLDGTPTTEHRPIEPCPSILARTGKLDVMTDDNMGSEWRVMLGLK